MTLKTFFEKFDTFADTPDAIKPMREIIIQLAVRGNLTERATGESSQSQLAKSEAFRLSRGKRGEPNLKDIPFEIPLSWGWVAVGDVMNMINGRAFKPDEWSDDGVPIIRIQNLNKEGASFNRCNLEIDRKVHVHDGEFLISWSGTPGTSFGAFIWNRGFAYLNQHIFRCELIDGVFHKGFLRLAINARLDKMISHAQGAVGLRHITKGNLESIRLPLPPLAEQKRIVEKVDELMGLCDRLEAQHQERETRHAALASASLIRFAKAPTLANIQFLFHNSYSISPADLRKTILAVAVQGKLVPQNPSDEPVDELLKRSLAERRALNRTETTEVERLLSEDALGYDIPDSWRWQRLDDLLIFGPTNGFSPKAVDYETPVRSLTLSATTSGRFKGEHSKFIATEVSADSDLWLRDGDILVQRGNTIEYVGVAAVYFGEPNCFVYPDLMMKLRVSAALDVSYVHLAMSHDASRDFLRARASGTSGSMPKINQTTLKSLPIPIPPLAEQHRIVAKVNQLMALVDQLENHLAASRAASAKLLEAIVAELTAPAQAENPEKEKIIDLHSTPEFKRTALAAVIVNRLRGSDTLGQTKLQKVLYLAEYCFGLKEIDSHTLRFARGPHDPALIAQVEQRMKANEWFDAVPRSSGKGKEYRPLPRAAETRGLLEKLWPKQAFALSEFIDMFQEWGTDKCERFATAYAAWNDLIHWNKAVTDEAILQEILEKWHDDKKKITKAAWMEVLRWMRRENYIPNGFGCPTREAEHPEFGF